MKHPAIADNRRIARVTGIPRFWHAKIRTDAFTEAARAAGAEVHLRGGRLHA